MESLRLEIADHFGVGRQPHSNDVVLWDGFDQLEKEGAVAPARAPFAFRVFVVDHSLRAGQQRDDARPEAHSAFLRRCRSHG